MTIPQRRERERRRKGVLEREREMRRWRKFCKRKCATEKESRMRARSGNMMLTIFHLVENETTRMT